MNTTLTMRRAGVGIPSVALFFFASTLWAQQSFVPTVIAAAGSPSSTLFGVYGGSLVRSLDVGKTWTPVYVTQAGAPQPPIRGFSIDPFNSSTVYLATTTAAGLFWKSTDAGQTWIQSSAGMAINTSGIDYFKAFPDTITYLYAKIGSLLYRSSNGGVSWFVQSNLPGSNGSFVIADSLRSRMYFIDANTFAFYSSVNEGQGWQQSSASVLASPPPSLPSIAAIAAPYFDLNDVYLTLNYPITGGVVVASLDGQGFTDQSPAGLAPFTQIFSASTGPSYAVVNPPIGYFQTNDSGQTWQTEGASGFKFYGLTAVDPAVRSTLYGVETIQPATTPAALVRSTDSGANWTVIPATITPSIAKPLSMFSVTLEQGAPYLASFSVQTVESSVWQTPVTLTTSGESWLHIGVTSGNTPLVTSIAISSAGLLPGTYTSTITIAAPQTFNKSVAVQVQLTIKPLGGLGPGFLISTAAGNGSAAAAVTTGSPTTVAIGDARALGIDPSGNVLISAGNRIWQLTGAAPNGGTSGNGVLTPLAGTGANAANGVGPALLAPVSDPDAISFDSGGSAYFTEFAYQQLGKLVYAGNPGSATLGTPISLKGPNQTVGSHGLWVDPARFIYVTSPSGVLHYDGSAITTAFQVPFSNPYSIVEDSSGNFFVSDMALNQIIKIPPSGAWSVYAGTGIAGFGGDGGAAAQAMLNAPAGIAFDSQGTLYIADSGNNRIRTVTSDGNMHTLAGSGLQGFAGDGATADFASFSAPLGVAIDANGNVYVADTGNNRVRLLTAQNTPALFPNITLIANAEGESPTIASNTWVEIKGTNLAPAGDSRIWQGSDFVNNQMPTSLDGVSATVNGVSAYVYYISPTQINILTPPNTIGGQALVVVTNAGTAGAAFSAPAQTISPSFFVFGGGPYVAAVHVGGALIGAATLYPGSSTPAKPGETIMIYANGFGATTAPVVSGSISQGGTLATLPVVKIGGVNAVVQFAGLVSPGEFQFNVVVPATLANGDQTITAAYGGLTTQLGTLITIHN